MDIFTSRTTRKTEQATRKGKEKRKKRKKKKDRMEHHLKEKQKESSNSPISCVTPYQTTERVREKGKEKKKAAFIFAGVRVGRGGGTEGSKAAKASVAIRGLDGGKREMKTLRGQVTVSALSHLVFLLPFSCALRSVRRREGKEGFGISRSVDLRDCCLWGKEDTVSISFLFLFCQPNCNSPHGFFKPQNTAHPIPTDWRQNRMIPVFAACSAYGRYFSSQIWQSLAVPFTNYHPPNFRHSQTKPNSQGPQGKGRESWRSRPARAKKRAKKIKKGKRKKK